jgi:hypothetical protein
MHQFGCLAGSWATSITFYPPDERERRAEGLWEFSYALGGRAVIDLWRVGEETALCVRVWDPRLQVWRFTYHGPLRGEQIHMIAQQIDDEMVLERDDGDALVRWVFFDIKERSFKWRATSSRDGGVTWRLDQTIDARKAE